MFGKRAQTKIIRDAALLEVKAKKKKQKKTFKIADLSNNIFSLSPFPHFMHTKRKHIGADSLRENRIRKYLIIS